MSISAKEFPKNIIIAIFQKKTQDIRDNFSKHSEVQIKKYTSLYFLIDKIVI